MLTLDTTGSQITEPVIQLGSTQPKHTYSPRSEIPPQKDGKKTHRGAILLMHGEVHREEWRRELALRNEALEEHRMVQLHNNPKHHTNQPMD